MASRASSSEVFLEMSPCFLPQSPRGQRTIHRSTSGMVRTGRERGRRREGERACEDFELGNWLRSTVKSDTPWCVCKQRMSR